MENIYAYNHLSAADFRVLLLLSRANQTKIQIIVHRSGASKELRNLRKFRYNSNYRNLTKLYQPKESFKTFLSEKASNWMNEYLLNLGHKRGKDFWISYKKLFNENKPNVGIIKNSHGELLYTMSEISKEFQETFFEGKYLHKQTFDDSMEKTVNSFLQQPEEIGEHDMEIFQDFSLQKN